MSARVARAWLVLAALGAPACDVVFGVQPRSDAGSPGDDGAPGGGDGAPGDAGAPMRCGAAQERWDSQLLCLEFEGGVSPPVDTSGYGWPINASGVTLAQRPVDSGLSQAGGFADTSLWVPDKPVFDLPRAFTLAAWVKVDQGAVTGYGSGVIDHSGQYAMYIGAPAASVPLSLRCVVATSQGLRDVAAGQLNTGTWNFLACTWDGNVLCAYANATAPSCMSQPALQPAGTGDVAVGHGTNGMMSIDPLRGALDRVQILGVALTADDVLELQAAP